MGSFAEALQALMDERGVSGSALSRQVPCDRALISRYLSGKRQPSRKMAARIDEVLAAGGDLVALMSTGRPAAGITAPGDPGGFEDEITAIEFACRAAASDTGEATVRRLEQAADDLATAYPGTSPAELLGRIRMHLGYVSRLLDGRKSLTEHRRLLVSAGWLSLLAGHLRAPGAIELLARHRGHLRRGRTRRARSGAARCIPRVLPYWPGVS